MAYTTNANAAGDGVFKMPSLTASLPSRIGFRGNEDLGGGTQAFFDLETGIGADMGTWARATAYSAAPPMSA